MLRSVPMLPQHAAPMLRHAQSSSACIDRYHEAERPNAGRRISSEVQHTSALPLGITCSFRWKNAANQAILGTQTC